MSKTYTLVFRVRSYCGIICFGTANHVLMTLGVDFTSLVTFVAKVMVMGDGSNVAKVATTNNAGRKMVLPASRSYQM